MAPSERTLGQEGILRQIHKDGMCIYLFRLTDGQTVRFLTATTLWKSDRGFATAAAGSGERALCASLFFETVQIRHCKIKKKWNIYVMHTPDLYLASREGDAKRAGPGRCSSDIPAVIANFFIPNDFMPGDGLPQKLWQHSINNVRFGSPAKNSSKIGTPGQPLHHMNTTIMSH